MFPESKEKTTFITHEGLYKWIVQHSSNFPEADE